MKFILQRLNYFQGKIRSVGFLEWVDSILQKLNRFHYKLGFFRFSKLIDFVGERLLRLEEKVKSIEVREMLYFIQQQSIFVLDRIKQRGARGMMGSLWRRYQQLMYNIKAIGFTKTMDDYDKRKLGIFNQLNFFQLITGIVVPIAGLCSQGTLPIQTWIASSTPAFISILVLFLNSYRRYDAALICYFILYPVVTSTVYMGGMNLGVELSFILYGILSVFFIQQISHMLFSVSLSMISYFMLAVVLKNYQYQLATSNYFFYLFNQILAIIFIFYGLFLIKKENSDYQFSILSKSRDLHKKNLEIQIQKTEIGEKASLLEKQTKELTDLNSLKNKLFSVIAHDLKTPMYALRNLFRNMQQQDIPATEIKTMIPDVVNDLNYTTGLMENLLQWAKSQMQSDAMRPQTVDVSKITAEVLQLLRLQAEAKQIYVESKVDSPIYAFADKDMINLVLRNLLSNAIKFTPEQGHISVGINEMSSFVEVFVQDSGTGISNEALQKIQQNDYFTTKGTASESGTGLGLMLCKEFLAKNGGQMHIESELGKGSVFSFTLPRSA